MFPMISNASRILKNEEKKEEIINAAFVVFLKLRSWLEMNLDNFRLIVHMYFMSLCNAFGIAD